MTSQDSNAQSLGYELSATTSRLSKCITQTEIKKLKITLKLQVFVSQFEFEFIYETQTRIKT